MEDAQDAPLDHRQRTTGQPGSNSPTSIAVSVCWPGSIVDPALILTRSLPERVRDRSWGTDRAHDATGASQEDEP